MQNQSLTNTGLPKDLSKLLPDQLEKIALLEAKIKLLGDICNELNPYQPLTLEFKQRLREVNIFEFDDPFKITNALLKLLEDHILELHILRPLSEEERLQENLR